MDAEFSLELGHLGNSHLLATIKRTFTLSEALDHISDETKAKETKWHRDSDEQVSEDDEQLKEAATKVIRITHGVIRFSMRRIVT